VADIFTKFDKKFISGDWEARQVEQRKREEALKRNEATQEDLIREREQRGRDFFGNEAQRNVQRGQIDDRYLQGTGRTLDEWAGQGQTSERKYQGALDRARDVENQNMTRASNTYTTMNPMYRDAMDAARENAQLAMTLKDYMDPNNQVAAGTRNLYNQEGEGSFQRYEQQAQNEQRQGLANYGVMSSLGAQAAANAMGGQGPMTVGQQMASMATANQAAAEGYANTQRRLQSLRDQGMSNREALRQLGLDRGFERTDKAYEAGRLAKEDAARRMGEYEAFQDRDIGRRSGISDRLTGIAGERRGSEQRAAEVLRLAEQGKLDLGRGVDMDRLARETGLSKEELEYANAISDIRSGRSDVNLEGRIADIQDRLAAINAQDEGRRAVLTGALSAGGSILGGMGKGGGGLLGSLSGAPAPGAVNVPLEEGGYVEDGGVVADAGTYPDDGGGLPQDIPSNPVPTQGYGLTSYYGGGYQPMQSYNVPQRMYGTGQTQPYNRRPTVGQYG
jgi:hypothetical protein